MVNKRTVTCRRCGQTYQFEAGAWLPACPCCGVSPVAMWRRMRDNRVAAILAIAALGVLTVAYVQPFMSMRAMGELRIYSLISGLIELWREGHPALAVLIFLFSVIFPIVKLTMILAATSARVRLSPKTRHRMHRFAMVTGKYSLLDVLIVAIMIVLVKFGEVVEVEAEIGTYLFCIAVLGSMAAGACVNFEVKHNE